MNDEKTHAEINNKLFKRSAHINEQLLELELLNSETEDKEPSIVGFSTAVCKIEKTGVLFSTS